MSLCYGLKSRFFTRIGSGITNILACIRYIIVWFLPYLQCHASNPHFCPHIHTKDKQCSKYEPHTCIIVPFDKTHPLMQSSDPLRYAHPFTTRKAWFLKNGSDLHPNFFQIFFMIRHIQWCIMGIHWGYAPPLPLEKRYDIPETVQISDVGGYLG